MTKRLLFLTALMTLAMTSVSAQILYKIEGKGGSPSYIFGSHHLSPISIVEDSGAMKYFATTDQVVGEIDLTIDPITLAMTLQPFMTAPPDSTLSVLLKGENMDSLNAQFVKWSPLPGMQLQMLESLKPTAIATMMASGMSMEALPGFDPEKQLDTYFLQTGAKEGKKIIALETPEYQGELLFNITPLAVQAESLIEMLKNPEEAVKTAQKLAEAYQNRDIETLLEVMKEDEQHPEFTELILYKRNKEWLEKIPDIIDEAASFIVVGALHLPGPEGVLQGLREKGYTITPIY